MTDSRQTVSSEKIVIPLLRALKGKRISAATAKTTNKYKTNGAQRCQRLKPRHQGITINIKGSNKKGVLYVKTANKVKLAVSKSNRYIFSSLATGRKTKSKIPTVIAKPTLASNAIRE